MSSTALVNARHASSALSDRVPHSCFFTSESRQKSQGERSGEYGGCGSSCISISFRKSTVVAAVCGSGIVLVKKKATQSRLWAALAPNLEDLEETVMHVPVRNDCPSVLKRNGGNMARFSEETGNDFLLRAV